MDLPRLQQRRELHQDVQCLPVVERIEVPARQPQPVTRLPIRPDQRPVVDITLGVPLSNGGEYEILGYLALPRLMVPQRWVRLSAASDARIELHGYNGLDLIRDLLT